MSKINVDFLLLSQLVHATLCSTEEVKEILQAECDVARNVLRSCPIETVITKEIDEQCCTCDSVSTRIFFQKIMEPRSKFKMLLIKIDFPSAQL